eukprot:608571-Pleurochrysis_carterae.AAC.3
MAVCRPVRTAFDVREVMLASRKRVYFPTKQLRSACDCFGPLYLAPPPLSPILIAHTRLRSDTSQRCTARLKPKADKGHYPTQGWLIDRTADLAHGNTVPGKRVAKPRLVCSLSVIAPRIAPRTCPERSRHLSCRVTERNRGGVAVRRADCADPRRYVAGKGEGAAGVKAADRKVFHDAAGLSAAAGAGAGTAPQRRHGFTTASRLVPADAARVKRRMSFHPWRVELKENAAD